MNSGSGHAGMAEAIRNGELLPSAQTSALLQEILIMLDALSQRGDTNSIDIRSLPLSPAEYEFLQVFFADGEVSANINALGLSEIRETRFPGVWWIRHLNAQDEVIAELIEVTKLPDMLKTQMPDLYQSTEALRRYIEELQRQR